MPLNLRVQQEFEECLSLEWGFDGYSTAGPLTGAKFVVEMVLDLARKSEEDKGPLLPAQNATVKRVEMGTDRFAFVQNMPEARKFLVCVVAKREGTEVARSSWVRASTLDPKARELDLGNRDPNGMPRVSCNRCSCAGYVPFRFSLNSANLIRCRRCGCDYGAHEAVDVGAILEDRQEKACKALRKDKVTALPAEALEWDTRECNLWFCTDGAVHPRRTCAECREQPSKVGGLEGINGKKGRVSVVSPTMETRQHFHAVLWTVFEAQTWPDKELVIVETYQSSYSKFFADLAATDQRVVYVKFQRPLAEDWSIGLKRNIGTHFATGEFIANFDDDDLYAPCYLTNMITFLEERCAQAIKLSSWFIFEQASLTWAFCDPIAWGLAKGLDETSHDVRTWKYGYGFSYVFRRRIGLDLCYDDINLGEDFNFITSVLIMKGENSVALFHDDFGICCHVQHGKNTSNSIPLRNVDSREARLLDVMELCTAFKESSFQQLISTSIAASLFKYAVPPSEKSRDVVVHTPQRTCKLQCAVCATAADVLEMLQERLDKEQKDRQPSKEAPENSHGAMRVYRVDPGLRRPERHKAAVDVLGLSFLAEMEGAEHTLSPATACGRQWREMLDKASQPIHSRDRVGFRTSELWVRAPAVQKQQQDDSSWLGKEEEFITVNVTCQKSSVKKFVSGSLHVQLLVGSTAGDLRFILGADLPPNAKIMAEKDEVGLVTMRAGDRLPSSVVLSDFRGRRKFYTLFTVRQNKIALMVLKEFLSKPEIQRRLDQMMSENGGDKSRYGMVLCNLLAHEAYPLVLKRLNISADDAFQTVINGMQSLGGNLELVIPWLETEVLMRNETNIQNALNSLTAIFDGVEQPYTLPEQVGRDSLLAKRYDVFYGKKPVLTEEDLAEGREAMEKLKNQRSAVNLREAAQAMEALKRIQARQTVHPPDLRREASPDLRREDSHD